MGTNFYFNPVQKIGQRAKGQGNFQKHEVAWKGECTKDDAVFDACLHLDGEGDPQTEPFVPLLPKNMLFGTPQNGQYEYRLVGNTGYGGPCVADPSSKRCRQLEPNA